MIITAQLLIGLLLSSIVAGLGYWRGALAASGALGAVVVGTIIFGLGGPVWGLVLVAFFVGSSLLSGFRWERKQRLAHRFDKGHRRDLVQTLANGGYGALLALAVGVLGKDSTWYPYLAVGYFGAIAAVNADTWATELGLLASKKPRMLFSREEVATGTSGAVSGLGTLAALAGGAFIALSTFLLVQAASLATTGDWLLADWFLFPVVTLAGLAGAVADSLMGGTMQGIYHCASCQTETESRLHRCGQPSALMRGAGWLTNDGVNFISSIVASVVCVLLAVPFVGWPG